MTTRIREVQPEDFSRLLDMAKAMHAESPELQELTFDESRAAHTIMAVFATHRADYNGWVMLTEGQIVGALFAYCSDTFYSRDLVAGDLVVYVSPEHRGNRAVVKMIRAYEAWARERGAKIIYLGVSTGTNTERSQRLFERLGYRAIGPILKKH